MHPKILLITVAAMLLTGCGTAAKPGSSAALPCSIESADVLAAAAKEDLLVEFNGITKIKSELSEDTLKWLEWYQSLPEDERDALSFVPNEFAAPGTAVTEETGTLKAPPYLASLTEAEQSETEELARFYFTEGSIGFDGVEKIQPADDSSPLYQNTGIEAEYDPGNIIIYMVLTGKDKTEGSPMRSISIARRSKSDSWKVINSGH
ncbi:hypothetical protein D3Z51_18210 [Clostridiaceae bacterium]|nr:hypothetical protein [Clostridiaceae bacterium]RKI09214.1 hypothetical protein D7V81_17690 [bacterium 1XD21-70]